MHEPRCINTSSRFQQQVREYEMKSTILTSWLLGGLGFSYFTSSREGNKNMQGAIINEHMRQNTLEKPFGGQQTWQKPGWQISQVTLETILTSRN